MLESSTIMTQMSTGTFTQLPDVLLLYCDVPDEAITLFARILAHTKFKQHIFYGGMRKLAAAVHMSLNKTYRNVQVLEKAGLAATGIATEINSPAVQLNLNDLWTLNAALSAGITIPRWNNLQTILGVLNLEQSPAEEPVLKIEQDVLNLEQKNLKIERAVLKPEQSVLPSSTKAAPKIIKNIKINKKNKKAAASAAPDPFPPPVKTTKKELDTKEQRQFWSLWLQVDQNRKVAPALTDTAREHVKALAAAIGTQQELDELVTYTRNRLREKSRRPNLWKVELGNIRSHFDEWDRQRPAPAAAHQEASASDPQELVLWSRHIDSPEFKFDKSVWYLYEWMLRSEAEQYDFAAQGPLSATKEREIDRRLEDELKGKLQRPQDAVSR